MEPEVEDERSATEVVAEVGVFTTAEEDPETEFDAGAGVDAEDPAEPAGADEEAETGMLFDVTGLPEPVAEGEPTVCPDEFGLAFEPEAREVKPTEDNNEEEARGDVGASDDVEVVGGATGAEPDTAGVKAEAKAEAAEEDTETESEGEGEAPAANDAIGLFAPKAALLRAEIWI